MPIHRDPIQQTLARLGVRLAELAAWRDREVFSMAEAKFRTISEENWRTVRTGDSWPAKSHPVLFQFQCCIPESWAGNLVHARFDVDGEALLFVSESTSLASLSRQQLAAQVRALATQLRNLGVRPGDRVVAWMPNIPQTVVAMLATTAIGAIWACCSPDFGERGVLDRFSQLKPTVWFCVDGYRYAGKEFDRRDELQRILGGLGSVRHVIHVPTLNTLDLGPVGGSVLIWNKLVAGTPVSKADFSFEQVPFDHPLWILFTSGTTGLPKPIVHGHGGILLEMLKNGTFHFDLHPEDRLMFFTTSGWMLWNFLVGSITTGAVPILYDGHPAFPEKDAGWRDRTGRGPNALYGRSQPSRPNAGDCRRAIAPRLSRSRGREGVGDEFRAGVP